MNRYIIFICMFAGCNTFSSLNSDTGGDTSGDVATSDVRSDASDDMAADAPDDGREDVGRMDAGDTGTLDMLVDMLVDMPPASNPYDLTADDDFFELANNAVSATAPEMFSIASRNDGEVIVAWREGNFIPGTLRAGMVSVPLDPSADRRMTYTALTFTPTDLLPTNPSVHVWTLGLNRIGVGITDDCSDEDTNVGWRHEDFPENGTMYLADTASCIGNIVEYHRPFIVGGRTNDRLSLESYAFGFFVRDNLAIRSGVVGETNAAPACGLNCQVPVPGLPATFDALPTHGHRLFIYSNGNIQSLDIFSATPGTLQASPEISIVRPGVAYIGYDGADRYAMFRVEANQFLASDSDGGSFVIPIDNPNSVDHIHAAPVRRLEEPAFDNLIVVNNFEVESSGIQYMAQRVFSFDGTTPELLACRRRIVPNGITKIDLQVTAFQRGDDLVAVSLSPYEDGNSRYFAMEGFVFPNLLAPGRERISERASPECQDFDPLFVP